MSTLQTHPRFRYISKTLSVLLVSTVAAAAAMPGLMAAWSNPKPPEPGGTFVEEFTSQPGTVEAFDEDVPVFEVDDTAHFIFGFRDELHGSLGGDQLFGSMDKVGVHTDVDSLNPTIGPEVAHMAADKRAREAFLAAEGTPLTNPNRTWIVRIWEVAVVGDESRYVVSARVGEENSDISTTGSDYSWMFKGTVLFELWKKHSDGSNPTLIRRSTQWAPPDTAN